MDFFYHQISVSLEIVYNTLICTIQPDIEYTSVKSGTNYICFTF